MDVMTTRTGDGPLMRGVGIGLIGRCSVRKLLISAAVAAEAGGRVGRCPGWTFRVASAAVELGGHVPVDEETVTGSGRR